MSRWWMMDSSRLSNIDDGREDPMFENMNSEEDNASPSESEEEGVNDDDRGGLLSDDIAEDMDGEQEPIYDDLEVFELDRLKALSSTTHLSKAC